MVPTLRQSIRAILLVMAIGLLDYYLLRARVRYTPGIAGAALVGVLGAQVGLASVWGVIGRDHLLARLIVLIAALAGVWLFLANWHPPKSAEEMTSCFGVQSVIVVAVLLIARLLGYQTMHRGGAHLAPTDRLPKFSIRDILLFTTLVCVALAAVLRMQSLRVGHDTLLISFVIGAFMACITLAAVFSMLTLRHVALPMVFLYAGSALLGWGIGTAIHYDTAVSAVSLFVPAAIQGVPLMLSRVRGYQFVRAVTDNAMPGEPAGA